MTLKQFVAAHGTQERAAQEIGVSFVTINKWLNGHTVPKGLYAEKLRSLGVKA